MRPRAIHITIVLFASCLATFLVIAAFLTVNGWLNSRAAAHASGSASMTVDPLPNGGWRVAPEGSGKARALTVEVIDDASLWTSKEFWASLIGAAFGGVIGVAGVWWTVRKQEEHAQQQDVESAYAAFIAAENRCSLQIGLLLVWSEGWTQNEADWERVRRDFRGALHELNASLARIVLVDKDTDRIVLAKRAKSTFDWTDAYNHAPFKRRNLPPGYTDQDAYDAIFFAQRIALYELFCSLLGPQKAEVCYGKVVARTLPCGATVSSNAAECHALLLKYTKA